MSQLSDAIATLTADDVAMKAALTQLGTDLTAEIARLQGSGVSPADLQNLSTIATDLATATAALGTMDTQAKGA